MMNFVPMNTSSVARKVTGPLAALAYVHRPELVQRIPLAYEPERRIVSWVTIIRMMEPGTVEIDFRGEKVI